jgi:hypothetical protein
MDKASKPCYKRAMLELDEKGLRIVYDDEPEEDTFNNPEIPASAFDAIGEADS